MTFAPHFAAKAIELSGKKLVGKTRLQKSVYFLEELGAGFGFEFDYHYYGPYSEDLSASLDGAEALDLVSVEWNRTNLGTKYAVFESTSELDGDSLDQRRSEILAELAKYDAISLELAATADFLTKNGFPDDPWMETLSRKPGKASPKRVAKSKALLEELSKIEAVL